MIRTIATTVLAATGLAVAGLFSAPAAPARAEVTASVAASTQADTIIPNTALVSLKAGTTDAEKARLIALGETRGLVVEDRGSYLYVKGDYRTATLTYRYQSSVTAIEPDRRIVLDPCEWMAC